MTTAQLETIIVDRALGALGPEVEALLDHYLAQNPLAARRANDLGVTLRLARAAVAVPVETPRPLDLAGLRRERGRARATARRLEFLRLTASLAAGLGLGWIAHPMDDVAAPAITAASFAPPTAPVTQFWSIVHFAPDAAKLQNQKKL